MPNGRGRLQVNVSNGWRTAMWKCKLIAGAVLASLSFAASADRADRRDEHYFWENRAITSAPAGVRTTAAPHRESAPAVAFGERGFRFVIPPSTRSRAEVIAELREAQRLGLLGYGEADPRLPTPEEAALIGAAGRAAAAAMMSSR
jgi:hypothetical protein